jgi:hypothetical protein
VETNFCSPRSTSPAIQDIVDLEMVIFTNHMEAAKRLDVPKFVKFIYAEKKGWPHDTEVRFKLINAHASEVKLNSAHYAFWTDADQLIYKPFCFDIMGWRVGAMHPHIGNGHEAYESRPESTGMFGCQFLSLSFTSHKTTSNATTTRLVNCLSLLFRNAC